MDFLASKYKSLFDFIGDWLFFYVTWVPGWFAGAIFMLIVVAIGKYVVEYVAYLFGKEFRLSGFWFIFLVLALSFPAGQVSKDYLDGSYKTKYEKNI